MRDGPDRIFATVATADQIDAAIAVIWWATQPPGGFALRVLDYQIAELAAVNSEWIGAVITRSAELEAEHGPAARDGCPIRVEHPGLIDVLRRADAAFRDTPASARYRSAFDLQPIRDYEAAKWPATLDERADMVRPLVNSGKVVKLETGLARFGFRAIRTNHLVSQIKRHRPGDAASAGELLHAFVLGVLLGTTPERMSWFDRPDPGAPKSSPGSGPFGGAYLPGRRPL
jgi:hypothetical protein